MQTLPPVSEALTLLDVSLVHNDGKSSPAAIRRAVQILVDHLQVQAMHLSRAEDALSTLGKSKLVRVEQLEQQLDGALETTSQLQSKQAETALRNAELSQQLEMLRDQVSALESRVGVPAGSIGGRGVATSIFASPLNQATASTPAVGPRPATAGAPAPGVLGVSMSERLKRLEQRADALSVANSKSQEDSSESLGRVRDLEVRLDHQLTALRTDIKQALVLAATSSRAEAEAEAVNRSKEAEKRLLTRIHTLEESVENRLSGLAAKVGAGLSTELDGRFSGVYEHVDLQVGNVRTELDRLSRDKVDVSSLDTYTARVSTSFEQVAGALGDEIRVVSEAAQSQVEGVRLELTAAINHKADKAWSESILSQHHELLSSLDRQLQSLAHRCSQLESDLDQQQGALRPVLSELQEGLSQLGAQGDSTTKSISGLNSALTSTSSALELQSHKLSALGHRLQSTVSEVCGLREALYGAGGSAATAALDTTSGSSSLLTATTNTTLSTQAAAPCLSARLAAAERAVTEFSSLLTSKTDETVVRELGRSLAALQRQADHSTEGVRALTQSTYKRVDEHAAAIQKLTLAINTHMEERPTLSMVRHLLESAGLEVGEKLATALLPVWDAVRALQGGLKEVGSDCKDCESQLVALRHGMSQVQSQVSAQTSATSQLVRLAVEDQLQSVLHAPESGVAVRLSHMEQQVHQQGQQVEVVSALQDRQQALLTALEDQLSVQQSSVKASCAAVRSELMARHDNLASSLDSRVTSAEGSVRQLVDNIKDVVSALSSRPVLDEVKAVAHNIVRQELNVQSEKDTARWQAWVELQAAQISQLATQSQLDDTATATLAAARQAAEAAEMAGVAAAHAAEQRAVVSARAEAAGVSRVLESRIASVEGQLEVVKGQLAGRATAEELHELQVSLASKADTSSLEAGLVGVEAAASRELLVLRHSLEAELARKLDVKTYLASSSSVAAAAAAATHQQALSASAQGDPAVAVGMGSATAAAAIARLGQKLRQSENKAAAAAH